MHILELDTPALAVDLDIMERNLSSMADYASQHHLRLRPHTKTHKSPWLAARQLELGAVGLTVAKTTEAEVMLAARPVDLLVAFPTIGAAKLARLRELSRQTSLSVSLDSLEAAQAISEAQIPAKILVEFDAGLGRVGVPTALLPELVAKIARLPHLHFDGLAFYPGHIKSAGDNLATEIANLSNLVGAAVKAVTNAGHAPRVVSGGSTPTWLHSHQIAGQNEIPARHLHLQRSQHH